MIDLRINKHKGGLQTRRVVFDGDRCHVDSGTVKVKIFEKARRFFLFKRCM